VGIPETRGKYSKIKTPVFLVYLLKTDVI